MRLLALDQALKITGIAFFEDGELCRIAECNLTGAGGFDLLHEQVKNLRGLIKLCQPEIVALEDVHIGEDEKGSQFIKTALSLSQLLGAMKVAAWDCGVRTIVISSPELTAYLYGRAIYVGRDKKKRASIQIAALDINASPRLISSVREISQIKISDHVADAVNIGRVALGKLKEEEWANLDRVNV